jgi:hypothetical protein
MLRIAADQRFCIRYFAEALLRQADAIGQYPDAARAIARASIEYMLSGPRWVNRPEPVELAPHPMGWRINRWIFHVMPRVDDDAVAQLVDLPRFKCDVDVLAPPWVASVARTAVLAVLPHFHVDVFSIDSYVDLRVLWTSLDLGHSHAVARAELLGRYKRLARTMPAVDVQCA